MIKVKYDRRRIAFELIHLNSKHNPVYRHVLYEGYTSVSTIQNCNATIVMSLVLYLNTCDPITNTETN